MELDGRARSARENGAPQRGLHRARESVELHGEATSRLKNEATQRQYVVGDRVWGAIEGQEAMEGTYRAFQGGVRGAQDGIEPLGGKTSVRAVMTP